jgi:hypothetical protein
MTRPYGPSLAEQEIRKRAFAPTAPAFAAKAASERRWINSRAHSVKIAQHNELISAIGQNNAVLISFDDPAMEIESADPIDLSWRVLNDRIAALGRLKWQQTNRLEPPRTASKACSG